MITEAYNKAEEIIRTHQEKLDAIVEALLRRRLWKQPTSNAFGFRGGSGDTPGG